MKPQDTRARRSLMSGMGALAAVFAFGGRPTAAQTPAATRFSPSRHAQDAWLDQMPGKHRVILDVTSSEGMPECLGFANNLYGANKSGYGIEETDLAIVICLRHSATAFAFTDAIWAKHGKAMADGAKYVDPKSSQPPAVNPFNVAARSTLDTLAKRGLRYVVCDTATHRIARQVAGPGGDAEAVYKELASHLIPNARFVPAGVVGVTRAQEYGYSLLSVG